MIETEKKTSPLWLFSALNEAEFREWLKPLDLFREDGEIEQTKLQISVAFLN